MKANKYMEDYEAGLQWLSDIPKKKSQELLDIEKRKTDRLLLLIETCKRGRKGNGRNS